LAENPNNGRKNLNFYENVYNDEKQDYQYDPRDKYILIDEDSPQKNEDSQNSRPSFTKNDNITFFHSCFDKLRTLLDIFGVPYVQAPQEAEAQCAFFEYNGLVDGVITEDSDTLLFGGHNIFRNLFNKGFKEDCQFYSMKNISSALGLDREKLIMLAFTLGCDYCIGIKGVGIVNSMEIVEAFSNFEALERFKSWAENPDYWLNPKILDIYQNKCGSKEIDYRNKHKNYKKHWELPQQFPDPRVYKAFVKPVVDESLEKFSWVKPNLDK